MIRHAFTGTLFGLVIGFVLGVLYAGTYIPAPSGALLHPAQPARPAPSVSGIGDEATAAALRPVPRTGRSLPQPTAGSHPARGPVPPSRPAQRQGVASFVAPSYGPRYLALPEGPGHRVRICSADNCVLRTSTDAGPDKAMQRAGRVADVSFADFRILCRGCDPYAVGLVRVTVTYLPAPPDTATEP